MLEIQEKDNVEIVNMIYEIRGKQVMLDSDLAKLYQCKNGTKSINLAVKRHLNRFPERFMFQLTEDEVKKARKVLSAAALTYVAAMAQSVANLLRLLLIVGGRRRDD